MAARLGLVPRQYFTEEMLGISKRGEPATSGCISIDRVITGGGELLAAMAHAGQQGSCLACGKDRSHRLGRNLPTRGPSTNVVIRDRLTMGTQLSWIH